MREVSARRSTGNVVVTAVGDRVLLAVVTDDGLDTAAFRREMPGVVRELGHPLDADIAS